VRIGINQNKKENEDYDTFGPEDTEVAGPGGANLTGGDVTRPQDAARASDEATQARLDSKKMEQRQQQGKVGHQRKVAQQREEFQPEADGEDYQTKAADAPNANAENDARDESVDRKSDEAGNAKKNSDTTSQLSDAKTQLLHLAADFENYKRASLRREEEIRERATRRVLEDLLPVLDNFERAVSAAETTTDVNSLKIGVEYILQQFREAMKNNGAEPIEAAGKPFDPLQHDAIEEVESDADHGTVVEDVQRGYLYKGKVIRPSRVKVAK
jgi:molecular chaperone GrpE